MGSKARRLADKGSKSAKKALKDLRTQVLAIEGRRSIRSKTRKVKRVSKKAATTGLIIGALAALEVVVRELVKRGDRA